ncbi:MAG: ArnT family glycosyltransferase [Nocardioides sp.]|uniref:ArnT family glycosyltransferase n=1 Tax=Nocardioides sp. TaxID=35761 RepID=UPI003F0E2768
MRGRFSMAGNRLLWVVAALAVVGRFPALLWPLRPDEAGFLLVARAWAPTADSVFGPYFVDRPPTMIAVVWLADLVGGAYFLRVVGALACALSVLLVGWIAAEVVRHLPDPPERPSRWVVLGPALFTAFVMASPQIDSIATKGELLGVPVLLATCLLALRALRTESAWLACGAGLCAVFAVGLKQSLVGGLVFGTVLLVGAKVAGRLSWPSLGRLTLAAAAGGLVPVVGTVVWALAAGVSLNELWYVVVGFRSDASAVIMASDSSVAESRADALLLSFFATGMGLAALWFVVRLPATLRVLGVVTVAAGAMLAGDLAGIVISGSYWRPYLFVPVPPLAVALVTAFVATHALPPRAGAGRGWVAWGERTVVALTCLSTVLSTAGWLEIWSQGSPPREYTLGRAIGAVSQPGDTLTVYGGRPDVQWASGLDSPYTHLWSLPMRTLDPDRSELRGLMEGDDAPTWFVGAVPLTSWSDDGVEDLQETLEERYAYVGTFCGEFTVYRLRTAPATDALDPDCSSSWRRTVLDAAPAG